MLEKIQNLPLGKRKIILWVSLLVIAAALFFWYIADAKQKLKNLKLENLKQGLGLSKVLEELRKIEFPGSGTSTSQK